MDWGKWSVPRPGISGEPAGFQILKEGASKQRRSPGGRGRFAKLPLSLDPQTLLSSRGLTVPDCDAVLRERC